MVELEIDDTLNNALILFADHSLVDIITIIGQKKPYENGNSDTRSKLETLAKKYQDYAKLQLESGKITVDPSTLMMLMGMLQSYEKYLKILVNQGIEKELNSEKLKNIPSTMKKVSTLLSD